MFGQRSSPLGRHYIRLPMSEAKDERDATARSREPSAHSRASESSSRSDGNVDSVRSNGAAGNELDRFSTRHSMGMDAVAVEPTSSIVEIPDDYYERLTPSHKIVLVVLVSYCAFLAPISSTSVLAATPEVAEEYNTSGSIVNLVNALYMLFMGVSPMLWGPLSQVYGRRMITLVTAVGFLASSIGTALAPNLAAFFVFRILTAFEGTSFLLVGAAVISDIYKPVERGTATGWFMSGSLIGPAFGPFLGGVIVTYVSWRIIFWLQTALAGVAVVGAHFLLPETIYHKRIDDLVGYSGIQKAKVLWGMINPMRILRLYVYPNLILIGLASASLTWNMYSLLTPIRYVLNPRYNLTTPMQGGLFYLAPGCGYLLGTFFGGRYADYIVKIYIKKRGVRIPEDRMISALPFMGIVIPVCMILYGWCVEKDVGGIPLTVVVLFFQGVAQLFCFPSLNTYCLDVMPGRSGEVIASNYVIRYLFACLGTAVVLPAVESIGIGWFSTVSVLFIVSASAGTVFTIRYGKEWRDRVDARKRRQKKKMLAESSGTMSVDKNHRDDAASGHGDHRGEGQQRPITPPSTQRTREDV
ncbi:hypothetical protein DL765_006437 [Monosporascus sp. GIB2]|nr:hypothetical protein DL765_006437 [Monosporascus sp. GIB2]